MKIIKFNTFVFILLGLFNFNIFAQSEKIFNGKTYDYSFVVDTSIWYMAGNQKLTNKMLQDTKLVGRIMNYDYLFTTDTLPEPTIPFFTLMVLPTQENVYQYFKKEYAKQFQRVVSDNREMLENYAKNIELGAVSFNDKKQTITSFIPISRVDGSQLINMMHIICDDKKFAQFTFASTKEQMENFKNEYLNIANSFNWKKQNDLRISLKNVASFNLPENFEIQAGLLKDVAEKVYNEYGIEYQSDEIVLQQKGLNNFNQQAFNTYFRIILKPIHEREGIYSIDFKSADLETTNIAYMKLAKNSLTSNTIFLNEFLPKEIVIDKITCKVFSYERQLLDKPPVTVYHYIIEKNDKIISLTVSYRTAEKDLWSKSINIFINSLNFN